MYNHHTSPIMRIKLTFYLTYKNVVGPVFDTKINKIIGSWESHNLPTSVKEMLSLLFTFLGQLWCKLK